MILRRCRCRCRCRCRLYSPGFLTTRSPLASCSSSRPIIAVLCVTFSANGMNALPERFVNNTPSRAIPRCELICRNRFATRLDKARLGTADHSSADDDCQLLQTRNPLRCQSCKETHFPHIQLTPGQRTSIEAISCACVAYTECQNPTPHYCTVPGFGIRFHLASDGDMCA